MLVDFTQKLRNLNGEVMVFPGAGGAAQPHTVGEEVAALIAVLPTDKDVPPDVRKRRFLLAVKIMQATGPIECGLEELVLISVEVDKSQLPPYLFGQIKLALEGKPHPAAKPDVVKVDPEEPAAPVAQSPSALNGAASEPAAPTAA